jgi:hypothetical protein
MKKNTLLKKYLNSKFSGGAMCGSIVQTIETRRARLMVATSKKMRQLTMKNMMIKYKS